MNQEKTLCWNLFFFMNQFQALMIWNSCLNLVDYFIINVNNNIFTYYNFSVSFGGLLAFIIGPLLFSKISNYFSIIISFFLSVALFLLQLFLVQINFDPAIKIFITTTLIFISGFFTSIIQGKGAGIAASQSAQEIRWFNFGGGMVGILVSIVKFMMNYFDPVTSTMSIEQQKEILFQHTISFSIFIFIFSMIFLFSFLYFAKDHMNVIDNIREKEIEDILDTENLLHSTKKSHSEVQIIHRSFDLQFGMFFQYVIVIQLVGFLFVQAQLAYDSGDSNRFKIYTIPLYMLFFNIGDTMGKFAPEKLFLKKTNIIHSINVIYVLIYVLFVYILTFETEGFWSNPNLRLFIIFYTGLMNGYNTNNFMSMGSQRFRKSLDKAKVGYYSIFFLLLGITVAGFINTLYLTQ